MTGIIVCTTVAWICGAIIGWKLKVPTGPAWRKFQNWNDLLPEDPPEGGPPLYSTVRSLLADEKAKTQEFKSLYKAADEANDTLRETVGDLEVRVDWTEAWCEGFREQALAADKRAEEAEKLVKNWAAH